MTFYTVENWIFSHGDVHMNSLQRQAALSELSTPPPLPEGEAIKHFSTGQIHRIQLDRGEAPCFRSDARYTCRRERCPLAAECRRRVAVWRR